MARQYPDALPTGYSLQEYTVRRVLGQGGFGITYLAYDEGLAKEVAIKEYFPVEFASRHADDSVSPRSDADNDDYDWGLDRFQDEARTLVLFRHPAIVPVYRRFEENGTAYMVMEYQQGEALSELMKRHLDDFTESDLMNIAGPVLDGLAEVHKAGYMHRDLKPGNIYIRRDGSPVLLDFGAARAAVNHKSKSLTSIVTPGYAPLEQYFAEGNQGPWTDIYGFAALLYQCVCGKLPPEAPARVRNDKMVSATEVGEGRFTEHFLKAIDAGLAINEEDRPQSVAAWHGLLTGKAPERKRRPDETVALVGSREKTPAAAKVADGKAKAKPKPAVGARQEPSFKQPALDRPGGEAAGDGRGGAARIAVFAFVGILLAGAGAAGGWLAVGGGESGPTITDGNGNGNGNGVGNGNGNGGNGGNGTNTALTPEEKRQKALEEARRKAQEEARRKAQAEAERRRREETARQRKARLDAERREKARLEAERRRKAEAERKRQADADRKRKAELERQRRQREEAERKRRDADAKRKAREEAERKRKAREEAERKRRELAAKNTIACPYLSARIRNVATTRRDCGLIAVTYRQALTNGYPGVTRGWRNRQSGARGTITILRSIKRPNGTFCRVFQQTVVFGGRYRRGTGTACLFGNQWRIVG